MKVGLVIARKVNSLSELKKYALNSEKIDLLLFPECYFKVAQLTEVSRIVAQAKKWLVCSYTDERKADKFEVGVVFNRQGKIVGRHTKTVLTRDEINRGFKPGKNIKVIETEFGKIGICVCFEIHFPEIAREYKLQGARVIFNPIGTGMYNEDQYQVWTAVGKVRASENRVYTLGCSHFADAIPLAYAFELEGKKLLEERNRPGLFIVDIPVEKMTEEDDNFSYIKKRTPKLYRYLRKAG